MKNIIIGALAVVGVIALSNYSSHAQTGKTPAKPTGTGSSGPDGNVSVGTTFKKPLPATTAKTFPKKPTAAPLNKTGPGTLQLKKN